MITTSFTMGLVQEVGPEPPKWATRGRARRSFVLELLGANRVITRTRESRDHHSHA